MQTGNDKSKLPSIYVYALATLLLAGAAGKIAQNYRQIHSPLEFDFGEGIVLWQAQHILDPAKTYRDISKPPYLVTHYPPVYHLATRAVEGWLGDWLAAGRWVSFLSGLGLALVLSVFVYGMLPGGPRDPARLLAGLFTGCSFFILGGVEWIRFARVDLIGLFLMFTGMALVGLGHGKLGWELLGVLALVLAGFTKHVFVTGPLVCLVGLLLVRPWRALLLGAWGGVWAGAGLAFWQMRTQGGFLKNLLGYNVHPYSVGQLSQLLQTMLRDNAVLLVLGLPVFAYTTAMVILHVQEARNAKFRAKLPEDPLRWNLILLTLHLGAAGLWLFGMGKLGSNINYAFPFLYTVLMGTGVAVWSILAHWNPAAGIQAWLLPGGLVVFGILMAPQGRLIETAPMRELENAKRNERQKLIEHLRPVPEPIYAEDMVALLQAGKDLHAETAVVTFTALAGSWDEREFVASFRRKEWKLILVSNLADATRYSPAVRQAIVENYEAGETIEAKVFYWPKSSRKAANTSPPRP